MEYRTLTPLFDELRGERIVVRPLRMDDAQQVYAAVMESLAEMRPWFPFTDDYEAADASMDVTRDYIARANADWLMRTHFDASLWDLAGERFLGNVGLHVRNWDIRSFEIGYWLRTSEVSQGYMSEGVRLLTDYAFNELAANRVMIRCDARNDRSAAIPRRLGFVYEGSLRQSKPDQHSQAGALRDMFYFSLVKSDPRWPSKTR